MKQIKIIKIIKNENSKYVIFYKLSNYRKKKCL